MPWVRTTSCPDEPPLTSQSYCICDDATLDLTPGTVGQTQTFDCLPCGEYGLQPDQYYCCNLSGDISE